MGTTACSEELILHLAAAHLGILRPFRSCSRPVGLPVSVGSPAFNDRISRDFYADAVVMAGGNPLAPEYGLIAEAQQAPAPGKLEDWPRYTAAFWLSTGKPAVVLVLCPHDKTAR
jgi:hypothetical protein